MLLFGAFSPLVQLSAALRALVEDGDVVLVAIAGPSAVLTVAVPEPVAANKHDCLTCARLRMQPPRFAVHGFSSLEEDPPEQDSGDERSAFVVRSRGVMATPPQRGFLALGPYQSCASSRATGRPRTR